MLTGHATVLLVEDTRGAADDYRDRLGFTVEVFDAAPETYATAERDACHVHLASFVGVRARPNREAAPPDTFDAYVGPDDVDALYAELRDRGATILQEPVDQPYGLREFRVADPDGHVLAFGRRYVWPDASPPSSG